MMKTEINKNFIDVKGVGTGGLRPRPLNIIKNESDQVLSFLVQPLIPSTIILFKCTGYKITHIELNIFYYAHDALLISNQEINLQIIYI